MPTPRTFARSLSLSPLLTSMLTLSTAAMLAGCGSSSYVPAVAAGAAGAVRGAAIQGRVIGGQNPVAAAHVYLFAAGTGGYGTASTSLLSASLTGASDAVGAYVVTGSDGSFSVSGDYTCTQNTQVYLYVLGGNTGSGTNAAAGLLAALGNCPSSHTLATQVPSVQVNEASTIAAAVVLAPYATDAVHIASAATAQSEAGLANAFANAQNLVSFTASNGALAQTPAGNGTVPQARLNTLANILAACVNTAGTSASPSTKCSTLFANTSESGTPTDTATAAIAIARNPGSNVANLYGLIAATGTPFLPSLGAAPADFSIALTFTGSSISAPQQIVIDAGGNAWMTDPATSGITELSPLGVVNTNTTLASTAYFDGAYGLALLSGASAGDMWITTQNGYLTEYLSATSGVSYKDESADSRVMKTLPAVTGSGLVFAPFGTSAAWYMIYQTSASAFSVVNTTTFMPYPYAVAVDLNNVTWTTQYNPANPASMSGSASLMSAYASGTTFHDSLFTGTNYVAGSGVAIDRANNVWVSDYDTGYLVEWNNAGTYQNSYSAGTGLTGVAIDGGSDVWTVNGGNNLVAFTNAGAAATTLATGATGTLSGPAVDISGNIWIANATSNNVVEVLGVATPVVAPLSGAVAAKTLGTAP